MAKHYHKNPRKITKKEVDDLRSSLAQLGDLSGIVHDLNSDEIIGGNQRSDVFDLDKCQVELVHKSEMPDEQGTVAHGYIIWQGKRYTYRQVRWTEQQCAEANIKANRLGGNWDWDVLQNDWDMSDLLEWGFEEGDFPFDAAPEPDEGKDTEPQIDKAEELREKWNVSTGQLWQLGDHRLICGDCTDRAVVDRVMMGERAVNFLSDPPYGIGWDTDYTRFTSEYVNAQKVNYAPVVSDDKPFDPRPFLDFDKVVLWGANWYCEHIPHGSWFVWDKRHPTGSAFLSDAELAWSKGGKGIYIYAETVQGAHRKEKAFHPTQKPVGLFSWCIEKAGMTETICDWYAGSGTTLIACQNLSRKCRAVEISPAYVAVALQRWSDHTGKEPVLIE